MSTSIVFIQQNSNSKIYKLQEIDRSGVKNIKNHTTSTYKELLKKVDEFPQIIK